MGNGERRGGANERDDIRVVDGRRTGNGERRGGVNERDDIRVVDGERNAILRYKYSVRVLLVETRARASAHFEVCGVGSRNLCAWFVVVPVVHVHTCSSWSYLWLMVVPVVQPSAHGCSSCSYRGSRFYCVSYLSKSGYLGPYFLLV
jgi:hypothetical protein